MILEENAFSIREATALEAAAIAAVQVESWNSTYAGIIPDEVLASITIEKRITQWQNFFANPRPKNALFVAEVANRIVGFASVGPNRYLEQPPQTTEIEGEVTAIYLLAEFQRRGIGVALMKKAAQFLIANGLNSMVVWVLEANESCAFYGALGGTPAATDHVTIAGDSYPSIGYVWTNLHRTFGKSLHLY